MPLKKLQEIIIHYSQNLYKVARNLARSFSIDYPYQGPVFAFALEGDRLKLTDNTQIPVTTSAMRYKLRVPRPSTCSQIPTTGICLWRKCMISSLLSRPLKMKLSCFTSICCKNLGAERLKMISPFSSFCFRISNRLSNLHAR